MTGRETGIHGGSGASLGEVACTILHADGGRSYPERGADRHATVGVLPSKQGRLGLDPAHPHPAGPGLATVVVVDDEPANVTLLASVLRRAGVGSIHGLTDPREAVATCLERCPDLLVVDMVMPHMDGVDVMNAVRDALPREEFVPVLVMTADGSTQARDRALTAGAKDFLTKPFDPAEVVLRIRNLLETRQLYATLQRHNAALLADIRAREEEERRGVEQERERRERIAQVVTGDALHMVFQPILDLRTREPVGVESLARFRTEPVRSPAHWFAEAAAVGSGPELELAAVRAAVGRLPDLRRGQFMSINVSPATALVPALHRLLAPVAERVVLELTEHARVDDHDGLLRILGPLRERGLRLAVDDAGAGYAGLRELVLLRPDLIKLDVDLTRGIDDDPARRALATAMVSFARDIDATLVAEGIETAAELRVLRDVGIGLGQGYHLARPGPLPSR